MSHSEIPQAEGSDILNYSLTDIEDNSKHQEMLESEGIDVAEYITNLLNMAGAAEDGIAPNKTPVEEHIMNDKCNSLRKDENMLQALDVEHKTIHDLEKKLTLPESHNTPYLGMQETGNYQAFGNVSIVN